MPYKDKEKQRAYQAKWFRENAPQKQEQTTYKKRRAMIENAKNVPCQCCKTSYPSVVMDLHHIDPSTKKDNVSKLLKSGSLQSLQEEIDKCVVLCSNCHRLVHAGLAEL